MTLADARARVPALRAVESDPAADAAFLERLADACDRYTPLVALDPPAGLLLDVTGCAHLFGGEAVLRADIVSRLAAARVGARAAVADTPEGARAFARFADAGCVPPGRQAETVAGLPTTALGIDPDTVVALLRAGLKTVGDLAARPRVPLAARFGEGLVTALARLLGEEDARLSPRRPLPAVTAERRFAEPIALVDYALQVLESLAGQVGRLLEARGEGGRAFEASFHRSDGHVERLSVETGQPVRESEVLGRLFRDRLDALADPLDPGFGFDLLRLSVLAVEPFAVRQKSLDGRTVAADEVAALVDRLGARFGAGAVVRFAPADTHVPERAEAAVPAVELGSAAVAWARPASHALPRPLHLFDPPQPIEALAEVPDGPPLRFRWRRVLHEVARAEGPERIAPEWWRATDGPTRDYYRVEDAGGRRFWLFRQGLYGEDGAPRWFLHGVFP